VFAPGFVDYRKGCNRLAAASDKVYQLLVHGWWFSPGTAASSTTKTGRYDIAEILLKVALNTKNQSINHIGSTHLGHPPTTFPNTEICQYEREFCHKWFILYSSFYNHP
jgi:hypothetical protein